MHWRSLKSAARNLYAPERSACIKAMSHAPQSRFCCCPSNIFDGDFRSLRFPSATYQKHTHFQTPVRVFPFLIVQPPFVCIEIRTKATIEIDRSSERSAPRLGHLRLLEAEAIHILLRVPETGDALLDRKDSSVMLRLAQKAFYPGQFRFRCFPPTPVSSSMRC